LPAETHMGEYTQASLRVARETRARARIH